MLPVRISRRDEIFMARQRGLERDLERSKRGRNQQNRPRPPRNSITRH